MVILNKSRLTPLTDLSFKCELCDRELEVSASDGGLIYVEFCEDCRISHEDMGYESGHQAGYEMGYDEGVASIDSDALWDEAWTDGHNAGYDEGYEEAKEKYSE